ncbi:MAG: bifunctional folylpolyglutamate synthase/dihydrofolate synthase [Lachnospiraceae bacterium]|nr:bifunctional folylpolyglutamate synthase/dihydrofolate synthase [Lachnospiraceae bacterium]
MLSYNEVIDAIQGKRRFGELPGAEVSKIMSAAVGNPERSLEFVHIAGTNGKGSTAAFLCEILKNTEVRTGLFTSPHLVSFRERIRIGDEYIPEDDVTRIGNMLLEMDFGENVYPTMFDYCLMMALIWFKEQGVKLVILETGLGGRLDSTNIIQTPIVSIITHIGYDHMAILGNTLSEIAYEKCGILKKGTYLVTEEQTPEAMSVIRKEALKRDIPLEVAKATELDLSLFGEFQKRNAGCAVACAKYLNTKGYPISDEDIKEGLKKAFWPGRMQLLSKNPLILIDGAHNSDGVDALKETLTKKFGERKFDFVMGVMADKDYEKMLEIIKPCVKRLTAVTVDYGRAESAENIASLCRKLGMNATASNEPIESILNGITEDTIVFGSLYFIGEILGLNTKYTK